jgi:hypothetical protein
MLACFRCGKERWELVQTSHFNQEQVARGVRVSSTLILSAHGSVSLIVHRHAEETNADRGVLLAGSGARTSENGEPQRAM